MGLHNRITGKDRGRRWNGGHRARYLGHSGVFPTSEPRRETASVRWRWFGTWLSGCGLTSSTRLVCMRANARVNLGGHLRDSTPATVSDRVTTCRQAKLERVSESDVRTSISFHNGKRNRLLARPTERHSSTQT